jgi:HPt (histidine-containing phosphotransfer) domain-containing protein
LVPVTNDVEASEAVPLDMSRLDQLAAQAGDYSIVVELSQIFVQDITSRLSSMRRAVARADLDELRRTAHTVKGSAGNFGAHRLAAQAAALELMEDTDLATEQQLCLVEQEFERVRAVLVAKVLSQSGEHRAAGPPSSSNGEKSGRRAAYQRPA